MTNARWTNSSDESNGGSGRFDGRADCVSWLAERLDESERMLAQDRHSASFQSFDNAFDAAASGRPAPVAARAWMAAALVAAGLMIVHLIVG
jgi:hypothetical protein